MQMIATRHQAVISSVLLGALAGSGALPFSKQSFVDVIRKTGKSVETNFAAFEDSYQTAESGETCRIQVAVCSTLSPTEARPGRRMKAAIFSYQRHRPRKDLHCWSGYKVHFLNAPVSPYIMD